MSHDLFYSLCKYIFFNVTFMNYVHMQSAFSAQFSCCVRSLIRLQIRQQNVPLWFFVCVGFVFYKQNDRAHPHTYSLLFIIIVSTIQTQETVLFQYLYGERRIYAIRPNAELVLSD